MGGVRRVYSVVGHGRKTMITQMDCDYYIVRCKDWYVRVGLHGGTKEEHHGFLDLIGSDIEYIGDLVLPLKSDIDVGCGIGTRKHGSAVVVTCRHASQMIKKEAKEKTFLRQQREMIVSAKKSQKELLAKKAEVYARRAMSKDF